MSRASEFERIAAEQAALRRVATIVARQASRADIFATIADELRRLLAIDHVRMWQFEGGGAATTVASTGTFAADMPVGVREQVPPDSLAGLVARTGDAQWVEDYARDTRPVAERPRAMGLRTGVASPIIVEGRLWGAIVALSSKPDGLPADVEPRMRKFTELTAAAIANADSRDELIASRSRLLTAADDARRRLVRDLHDGAQQRLVQTIVALKLSQQALGGPEEDVRRLIAEALDHAEQGQRQLRDLAHGILPSALVRGGLRAGIEALVARLGIPVAVEIAPQRLPEPVEASAYFIVAEALTNVVKHARAEHVAVRAFLEAGSLRVEVHDDGVGGADPAGSGLLGLADRATALGGRLDVKSEARAGTVIVATLPIVSSP